MLNGTSYLWNPIKKGNMISTISMELELAFVTTNTPFLTLGLDTKRGHLLALMVLMIAHHLSHLDLLDHGKLYNKYLH